MEGFLNVLEGCRHHGCGHLLFASSSSVYGANTRLPFSVQDNVDHPISLYAASKKANELMAHAYSQMKNKPPHPVYFASVTAEEKGLLGSRYLGAHPPIPAAQIALDLNYDAIPPIGVPESVNVTGAGRTSFYPTVERTAKAFRYEIEQDANPGAGHYYRSDHFSFARVGVPAFSIGAGVKFADHPKEWGKAQEDDYTANRYHRPGDEWRPDQNYTSDAKLAGFGLILGWEALSGTESIGWLPGDEFAAARVRGEKFP